MDLPADMIYEISRHADAKTMFNMCVAHKGVWERQKKSLYDREHRRFVTEINKEIRDYKLLNNARARSLPTNIRRLHKMIRIMLKYKHVVKNMGRDYHDMLNRKFIHWGENGMCKKKIKMYKKSLDLF